MRMRDQFREFGFLLQPGVGKLDGATCESIGCPRDAICRVFTSDERHPTRGDRESIHVNVVCAFHAIVYVGVWLDKLLRDDLDP
jgi:hypothetical protein